jgi:hypothetical protein
MPIMAVRYANLGMGDDGRLGFQSVNSQFGTFGVEARAECKRRYDYYVGSGYYSPRPPTGSVPHLECECGFYAVPADKLPNIRSYESSTFKLLVEISGRVIEHERGYRASHQRVLEAQIVNCVCGQPAESIWMRIGESGMTMLSTECGEHRYMPTDAIAFTTKQLTGMLGVPIRPRDSIEDGC